MQPHFGTQRDVDYREGMERHLLQLSTSVPLSYLVTNFAKYVSRQELTRFLVRHELFKMILPIKGSIVECGVYSGNGVMSWAQLSAIYEPVSFFRRVFGFDTFAGFPSINEKDQLGVADPSPGDLKDESYEDLLKCVELFDSNRFLSQIPKVELFKGDFLVTGERFLADNPHVLIALLYLDFDIYEPTKKALELFLPRMCKGSVVCFDELNCPIWPGETLAMLEKLDIRTASIQQFPYEPNMSYIVL